MFHRYGVRPSNTVTILICRKRETVCTFTASLIPRLGEANFSQSHTVGHWSGVALCALASFFRYVFLEVCCLEAGVLVAQEEQECLQNVLGSI
jgi:hypothetical protein